MHHFFLRTIAILFVTAFNTSFAQTPSSLTGVWQGTLGSARITACFNSIQYDTQAGSYYYHEYLEPIPLAGKKQIAQFKEPNDLIEWHLKPSLDGLQLNGTWTKAPTATSPVVNLAITLKPVIGIKSAKSKDIPCATDSYLKPITQNIPLIKSAVKTFQNKHYLTIKRTLKGVGSVEAVQLLEKGPKYQRLNTQFMKSARADDLIECLASNMYRAQNGNYFSHFGDILIWGNRWFVAKSHVEGYCGGAHPFSDTSFTTYDLKLGAPAALAEWFKFQTITKDGFAGIKPSKTLLTLLLQRSSTKGNQVAECYKELATAFSYYASLSPHGMVFSPSLPHASSACGEDITLPYAALNPFLSTLGKREVNAIRKNGF